jgi:hypothetical protein
MGGSRLVTRYDQSNIKILTESLERFDNHHVCAVCYRMYKLYTFCMKASDQKLTSGYFSHKTSR